MKTRKPTPASAVCAGVIVVLSLVLAPAAFAGKGGGSGGGSSTITGPVMVTDVGTPGLSWGDTVTFNVSTTATTQPYVNLLCYQNGVLVANGWNGFFDQALNPTRNFALYSGMWKSGAANCTAWLDMYTKRGTAQLASVSFSVAG